MSQNMSAEGDKYKAASEKFQQVYDKYYTDEAFKQADDYARQMATQDAERNAEKMQGIAEKQSLRAGNMAASNALKAGRTAGMSKAQAGLKAGEAAADTTANSYKNVYNDVYNSTYQNTYNGLRGDKLSQNANAVNAQAGQVSTNQQEDQNEYNRSWGNLGGWGSFVSGLLTSDERLKRFKDISFDEDEEIDDLKVYYKKEKK
jgi:hypothetical protein